MAQQFTLSCYRTMFHEFRWRAADVLRLVGHSREAAERRMTFGQMHEFGVSYNDSEGADRGPHVPAGLNFVKDRGVYLMSNATRPPGVEADAVYAEGYAPPARVGGDDFAEFLPAEFFADLAPDEALVIRLNVYAETFEMRFEPSLRGQP